MKSLMVAAVCLLSFAAKGDLLVSSFNNGRVYRFNEHTGQYVDMFISNTNGLLSLPHGLAFGSDGNLYVASAGTLSSGSATNNILNEASFTA